MSVITAITPQKNGKRVNIYLDNEFAFGLDLENFVKFNLKVDQELEEEKINKIIKEGEFQKTLDRLLRFATFRSRSIQEIKFWYKRKKVPETIQDELFDRLKSLELIDDTKFAKWWVEQRQAFSPKTKRILNYELRIKGINNETIKQVLENTEIDEVKLAKDLIKLKSYKWERFDLKIKKQKISQYLAGKGFDWNVINDVLK